MKTLLIVSLLILPACTINWPVPEPTPSPTVAPTVEPTVAPTVAPTALPTPPPAAECRLPASTGVCVLDPAVRELEAEHRFAVTQAQIEADKEGLVVGGVVLNERAYTEFVANELRKMGFCAISDKDEVLVKNVNSFSEHYDLVVGGSGEVWQHMAAKCRPAFF